jgi:uncharacterized protein
VVESVKYFAVFLLWNLLAGGFILFAPPSVGLPVALLITAALLWGYLLRAPYGTSPRRRWATLRLRPLRGASLRWSLFAVPVLLLLSWTLSDVYGRLVDVPAESLNPFEPIMSTSSGRLSIAVFAIAVAPIVEEFFFRGLIQRRLERKRGTVLGIGLASALFAAVHVLPWVFPLHFFLGMAFGFAVFATRSIWTGVILHAANNSVAMIGVAFGAEQASPGTVWDSGITPDLWVSVAMLLGAIALGVWTARKLLESAQEVGLPTA